jgi:hypothetical protein
MSLSEYSNPEMVYKRAKQIFGNKVYIFPSTRKSKKYMIYDNRNDKFIHFGSSDHFDYTKYIQLYGYPIANQHRERYLKRALKIKGMWMKNRFSPNWLSIHLLWMKEI